MEMQHLQHELFNQVKLRLNGRAPLAESISKVLDISVDSAYRRIRGETLIDLEEAKMLCLEFGISLDALIGYNDGKIVFSSNLVDQDDFDFSVYLQGVLRNMQYFLTFEEKRLFYECKDIPLFYHYHSREMAAFKYYFWMRFLYEKKSFRSRKFSFADFPDEIFDLGKRIYNIYNCIPSVEFWNLESINSTLRQIRFFQDIGCFARKGDLEVLYTSVLDFVNHLEESSEAGYKTTLQGLPPDLPGASFDVYYNEVMLGNNMIVARLGASQMTFLNHSVFNYVITTDARFGAYISRYLDNVMKSSTRLSTSNAVERNTFFGTLREYINGQIQRI